MKNNGVFTDRRLLQAIDLIDPKFIAEVFDDLKVPDTSKGYVSDKHGLHRAYRQLLALAACLILLSAAFPIAHYVLVNYDFQAGGWGSESTTEDLYNNESDSTYSYPMFVTDLEQLSFEEMKQINNMWNMKEYEYKYNYVLNMFLKNGMGEEQAINKANEHINNYIKNSPTHYFFNENYYSDYRYYGKINNYYILVSIGVLNIMTKYTIADYEFVFSTNANIYVVSDNAIYSLREAYELDLLTEDNIGTIFERHIAYTDFLSKSDK